MSNLVTRRYIKLSKMNLVTWNLIYGIADVDEVNLILLDMTRIQSACWVKAMPLSL